MITSLEQARIDIAAFADDEASVEVTRDGTVVFDRLGQQVIAQIKMKSSGECYVVINGQSHSYRRFLSEVLCSLSTMAGRLIEKRPRDRDYVDSPCELRSLGLESRTGFALSILQTTCESPAPFQTRLAFVTADAGQGKTAALRQFQFDTAQRFREGRSDFLFWHVDLQGRQLVRLNEALMGDLGDLRMSGIYMPSVVRLIHHGLIILAIDGFDELAVEQGSVDALGALSALVSQLDGRGTIIAASRRTFFDTDDYIKRTRLLNRSGADLCEIDQIQILPWTQRENRRFLTNAYPAGIEGYGGTEETLGVFLDAVGRSSDHPLLTRPFLFTFAVRSASKGMSPTAVRNLSSTSSTDAMESVKRFVDALIERDVVEKWKSKEGRPYLTVPQHRAFLAEIASEMWAQQRDRMRSDTVEQIAASLLELWDVASPQQVMGMVKMHALLPPATDGNQHGYRKFDHPEFQNYFLAVAFCEQARKAIHRNEPEFASRFLSVAQLPESVGRYACMLLREEGDDVEKLLHLLQLAVKNERRPTHLQLNVGSIVPWLMHDLLPVGMASFEAKVPYSKLAFEGTSLLNREFRFGDIVSASFQRVKWQHVVFRECVIADVAFDECSHFSDVVFTRCDLQSIVLQAGTDNEQREYVPERIAKALRRMGIVVESGEQQEKGYEEPVVPESRGRKSLQKLMLIFGRTMVLYDDTVERKFYSESDFVLREVIPLLVKFDVLQPRPHQARGVPRKSWQLRRTAESVLQSEERQTDLSEMWRRLDELG